MNHKIVGVLLGGFLTTLGALTAQIQAVLPPNYGITGVRPDSGGNYLVSGGTNSPSLNVFSPAFLYYGTLDAFPSTVGGPGLYTYTPSFGGVPITGGAQFYGPNTAFYNPSIGVGNVSVVGAYKATAGATYQNGMIYHGPLDGTGTWTAIVAPGNGVDAVGDTIPHSTMGELVVGNFDYQATPLTGQGFILNTTTNTFKTINFGLYSTTAYGIWQNGGASSTKYSIVGGFSDAVNGGKAYIVNYDSATETFSDFTPLSFNNDPTIITHFEGISAVTGGFSVTSTTASPTVAGAGYAFIPQALDGSFGTPTWTAITNNIDPSATTTGDTVVGTSVMGIFTPSSGNATSYIATVPEPSTLAMLIIGGMGAVACGGIRRRAAVAVG